MVVGQRHAQKEKHASSSSTTEESLMAQLTPSSAPWLPSPSWSMPHNRPVHYSTPTRIFRGCPARGPTIIPPAALLVQLTNASGFLGNVMQIGASSSVIDTGVKHPSSSIRQRACRQVSTDEALSQPSAFQLRRQSSRPVLPIPASFTPASGLYQQCRRRASPGVGDVMKPTA